MLEWDLIEDRRYETGIDRGVLYLPDVPGIAWNGLISVNEGFVGGEPEPSYFDGVRYHNAVKNSHYQATLRAFTYPIEFEKCLGLFVLRPGVFITGQKRIRFGLSFRTNINETDYKLHLIYNATASSTEQPQATMTETVTPVALSWIIDALPPSSSSFKPTAHIVVDSRLANSFNLHNLEDVLYGTDENPASLPTQDELMDIFGPLPT